MIHDDLKKTSEDSGEPATAKAGEEDGEEHPHETEDDDEHESAVDVPTNCPEDPPETDNKQHAKASPRLWIAVHTISYPQPLG